MKKLIILLVVVCSAASCAKEEIYSCNTEADLWAKSNVTEIQQMTRADFLAIGDLVYQRAAFNAFTPNQKQALWIGKMEEVLKLDWTEQERQHIQSMFELIKVNSFIFSKKRDQGAFDKVEVEFYKWADYAEEKLGWDKNLLSALIATPQAMNAKKEIVETSSNMTTPSRLKSGNETARYQCNCNRDHDFCSSYYSCLNEVCYRSSDLGCGWVWVQECNGLCGNY